MPRLIIPAMRFFFLFFLAVLKNMGEVTGGITLREKGGRSDFNVTQILQLAKNTYSEGRKRDANTQWNQFLSMMQYIQKSD